MKKGFTIIEIVFVLIILSVIVSITLKFSGDKLNKLINQSSKESFYYNYDKIYFSNISTNYYKKNKFEKSYINLLSGNNFVNYGYIYNNQNNEYKFDIESDFVIKNMELDEKPIGEISIFFKPYDVSCNIKNTKYTGDILKFAIGNNKKNYCFEIKSRNCKLQDKKCK